MTVTLLDQIRLWQLVWRSSKIFRSTIKKHELKLQNLLIILLCCLSHSNYVLVMTRNSLVQLPLILVVYLNLSSLKWASPKLSMYEVVSLIHVVLAVDYMSVFTLMSNPLRISGSLYYTICIPIPYFSPLITYYLLPFISPFAMSDISLTDSFVMETFFHWLPLLDSIDFISVHSWICNISTYPSSTVYCYFILNLFTLNWYQELYMILFTIHLAYVIACPIQHNYTPLSRSYIPLATREFASIIEGNVVYEECEVSLLELTTEHGCVHFTTFFSCNITITCMVNILSVLISELICCFWEQSTVMISSISMLLANSLLQNGISLWLPDGIVEVFLLF